MHLINCVNIQLSRGTSFEVLNILLYYRRGKSKFTSSIFPSILSSIMAPVTNRDDIIAERGLNILAAFANSSFSLDRSHSVMLEFEIAE